jgi:hypothetical protein
MAVGIYEPGPAVRHDAGGPPGVTIHIRVPARIRAIRLSQQTKHDLMVMGTIAPFIGLMVADMSAVSLWASIPGVAVIITCCMIALIHVTSHFDRRR